MLEGPVGSVIHRPVLMSTASDFNSFGNRSALLREKSVLLISKLPQSEPFLWDSMQAFSPAAGNRSEKQ